MFGETDSDYLRVEHANSIHKGIKIGINIKDLPAVALSSGSQPAEPMAIWVMPIPRSQ